MSKPIALYQDENYFRKAILFKLGWLKTWKVIERISLNCAADYFDLWSITVFVLYDSLRISSAIYYVEIYV